MQNLLTLTRLALLVTILLAIVGPTTFERLAQASRAQLKAPIHAPSPTGSGHGTLPM
ncbi:hypothetical protein ACXYMW_19540 [Roseivivax sp. CAU 1761]